MYVNQTTPASGAQTCCVQRNAALMGTVKMANACAKSHIRVSAATNSAAQVTAWEKDVVPMEPAYAKMAMPERIAGACGV